jgi:hypothetical protein
MATTQLRRDPFARMTLMRDSKPNPNGETCSWCGQAPRTLYRYYWEGDYIVERTRINYGHSFCSVGCWEDYNS